MSSRGRGIKRLVREAPAACLLTSVRGKVLFDNVSWAFVGEIFGEVIVVGDRL